MDTETKLTSLVSDEDATTIKQAFTLHGMDGVKRDLNKTLHLWQTQPLNVGITGNTGTGKSTFINAIRDMKTRDVGGAKVGVKETTMEPLGFYQPGNTNMIFWDLPGVGTKLFPKETYLKKIQIEKFDFFLIISSNRVTENDIWLANTVRSLNKTFFFIRTKISLDIRNNEKAHPRTHSDDVVLLQIRTNCEINFAKEGLENVEIFLIDSYNRMCFDFNKLTKRLIDDAPSIRREHIVLSITMLTRDVILERQKALIRKIGIIATVLLFGMPFVPVVREALVEYKALDLAKEFRVQLQLTPEDLEKHALELGMAGQKEIEEKLELQSTGISLTNDWIQEAATTKSSSTVEKIAKLVPFYGHLITGGNVQKLLSTLCDVLDTMVEDALKINKAWLLSLTN